MNKLDKLLIFSTAILILVSLTVFGATIDRNLSAIPRPSVMQGVTTEGIKCAFGGTVTDQTIACGKVIGKLRSVVIDSTGADTSYKVYVKDSIRTIWSKTDCTSASEPYTLPITMTDGSDVFTGVPMADTLSIQIADCDDSSMSDIDVYVFYER